MKRRQGLTRRTGLARGGPPTRRTGFRSGPPPERRTWLRPRNEERLARLREEQFGPEADWYRTLPCATCAAPAPSDPSHVRHTRGAGGKARDQIPQCWRCHDRFESGGRETYAAELRRTAPEALRQVAFPELVAAGDLAGLADAYAAAFDARTG